MDRKYQIDTEENRRFMGTLRDELLRFGRQFPAPGGGAYYLGDDGRPWTDRNIETWITCRMAHVYSIGALLEHEGSRPLAEAALRGLQGSLRDREVGGWYAGRTASGEIVPTKQCYAHAFVILAATSGILAGIDGSQELLEDALQIFDRFFWNEAEGLTWDTWNTAFTRADDYRGINANMHTVEAFLAVADVTGSAAYRARAGRIIDHVIGWARDNSWRIPEHFTGDWHPDLACNQAHPDDPFKPYGATPGHGIEWARLITQWALSTYGPDQTKCAEYHSAARELYDRAVTDGWSADGAPGIVYTTDWSGHPVVRDRMHWTLAEAINTSAVLYRVSRDQSYVEDYARFLRYLDQQVRDPIHGSWFHQLDAQNRVIGTVWPGKPDLYHALQATLIPYCDPARSVATFLAHSPAIS